MFKNLIILILSATLLNMTNPDEVDFNNFYKGKIEKLQEDSGIIDKVILETKGLNAKLNVKSEDKMFFSIYTVSYMGKEEKYLGIAKRFINIEKAKEKAAIVKDGVKEGAKGIKEKIEEN